MSQLQWDELDLLECLGVVPDEGEHGEWYTYTIEQNGLRLELTLWPFESMVCVSLFRAGSNNAIFNFCAAVRGNVRRVNDKRGEYLEFGDSIIVADRFGYLVWDDLFDKERLPTGNALEVFVFPDICLRFV